MEALVRTAGVVLPLIPAGIFIWAAVSYRNGSIRDGFGRRIIRALIVSIGVAIPVVAHWNYDWYSTYSAAGRHVFLLACLAIALVLSFTFLLQPIWHENRRRLALIHVTGLIAFATCLAGVIDPVRLVQIPDAFFTIFVTTLVAIGEAIVIWQVTTSRDPDRSNLGWIAAKLSP